MAALVALLSAVAAAAAVRGLAVLLLARRRWRIPLWAQMAATVSGLIVVLVVVAVRPLTVPLDHWLTVVLVVLATTSQHSSAAPPQLSAAAVVAVAILAVLAVQAVAVLAHLHHQREQAQQAPQAQPTPLAAAAAESFTETVHQPRQALAETADRESCM